MRSCGPGRVTSSCCLRSWSRWEPPEARGGERCDARLAVLHREGGSVEHRVFREFGDFLTDRDVLVLNNARVVPTILHGEDADCGPMVLSVFSPMNDGTWHCLTVPTSACRPGAGFSAGAGQLTGRFLRESDSGVWNVVLESGDPATVYRSAEAVRAYGLAPRRDGNV